MTKLKKMCFITIVAYIVFVILFRVCSGDSFLYGVSSTTRVVEQNVVGELVKGLEVTQAFVQDCDYIDSISILGTNYGKNINDTLKFSICTENGEIVSQSELKTQGLEDGQMWEIVFDRASENHKGQNMILKIQSENGTYGNAVSIYYGNSYSVGKYEIASDNSSKISIDNNDVDGELCFSVKGINEYILSKYYWHGALVVLIALIAFCTWLLYCDKTQRNNIFMRLIAGGISYRFLLEQLVERDFKTKYKRSVLGILWSLMNPLLTMLVMYIVFSTLFKSNIDNFPVYLLSGIVCWNYFSEVSSFCLTSITGNTSLITKVYVPKYIYPLSRVLSATVNLVFSLIPLVLVLFLTKSPITLRILLVPIPMVCLFFMSFGIGLILASSMVYFRDTQFLWGVISMLWMYLTPIFYDAEIIPQQYMFAYKLNPLYHIIGVMRTLLIDGMSPSPVSYLLCLCSAIIPLFLGILIFKKTQDKFVLYL